MASAQHPVKGRPPALLAGATLAVGCIVSMLGFLVADSRIQRELSDDMTTITGQVRASVDRRIASYISVLEGVRGLFDSNENVDRRAFRGYVRVGRREPRSGGVCCDPRQATRTSPFEVMSKRRRGFPSETHVKRGHRVVDGDKLLEEKLGRNDLCPCGSRRRFQALLLEDRPLSMNR